MICFCSRIVRLSRGYDDGEEVHARRCLRCRGRPTNVVRVWPLADDGDDDVDYDADDDNNDGWR